MTEATSPSPSSEEEGKVVVVEEEKEVSSFATSQKITPTSPFLRLPLELREAIYHHVLGPQTIHISRQFCSSRHGDLDATICQLPASDWIEAYTLSQTSSSGDKDARGVFIPDAPPSSIRNPASKHFACTEFPKGRVNLLHVCRQVYRDTSLMLYSVGRFGFNDEFALETFVMEALNERQRGAIRHVQMGLSVRAGMNFARCLEMLPNLRKLEVHVAFLNGDLFTPWLAKGGLEMLDDEVEFPVRLERVRVEVIAGFDKGRQNDSVRAARRKVASRLEQFLTGFPVDEDADVPRGNADRTMATWRYLLRNGCNI